MGCARPRRPLGAAAAAALTLAGLGVVVPAASAHGGGDTAYQSRVVSVTPPVTGLTVAVLGGDDRLRLTNDTGAMVAIQGYGGEPYLRFTANGVLRNRNSPATYLNDDRYGDVDVPTTAAVDAAPDWERVAAGDTYTWHDHHIHWMDPDDPPAEATVIDWRVLGTAGGQPFAVRGTLEYAPASGADGWAMLVVPVLAAVPLAAAAVLLVRTRRREARALRGAS
jgi:hypothetical protein